MIARQAIVTDFVQREFHQRVQASDEPGGVEIGTEHASMLTAAE